VKTPSIDSYSYNKTNELH